MKKTTITILCILFLIISCNKNTKIQPLEENKNPIIPTFVFEQIQEQGDIDFNDVETTGMSTETFRGEGFWEHEPGYYYTLDYPVRISSQSNLQGEIIGTLELNSRIRVLSCEGWESLQKIDNVWAPWYMIQFENITGYVWGGYIAAATLVFDIDNNGIDDYFHYRVSDTNYVFYHVDAKTDVFIYINNKKISTTDIRATYSNGYTGNTWQHCKFQKTENNTVLIIMTAYGGGSIEATFEIDATGKIVLINLIEDDDY
jgi:hypothetical protein